MHVSVLVCVYVYVRSCAYVFVCENVRGRVCVRVSVRACVCLCACGGWSLPTQVLGGRPYPPRFFIIITHTHTRTQSLLFTFSST